jgi:hypothetical protein
MAAIQVIVTPVSTRNSPAAVSFVAVSLLYHKQYQIDYVRVFEMTPAEAKLTKYPFPGKVIPVKTPGYTDDPIAAGSYHVDFKTDKLAPSPLIRASVRIDMVSLNTAVFDCTVASSSLHMRVCVCVCCISAVLCTL